MGKIAIAAAVASVALWAAPADAHDCGNQDTDNRPNHCTTNGVHRGSTCTVSTTGGRTCTYTHCDGTTTSVSTDPRCCCVNYRACTDSGVQAQYWALCVGGVGLTYVDQTEPDELAGGVDHPPIHEGGTASEPPPPPPQPAKTCASCSLSSPSDGVAAGLLLVTSLLVLGRRRAPRRAR